MPRPRKGAMLYERLTEPASWDALVDALTLRGRMLQRSAQRVVDLEARVAKLRATLSAERERNRRLRRRVNAP